MKSKNFKILSIDHIAVASLDSSHLSKLLVDFLGMHSRPEEKIENEKVIVTKIYAEDKNTAIELIEPSDSSSTIQKFINKKGKGLHHIALTVDSIKDAILYLKSRNIQLIIVLQLWHIIILRIFLERLSYLSKIKKYFTLS